MKPWKQDMKPWKQEVVIETGGKTMETVVKQAMETMETNRSGMSQREADVAETRNGHLRTKDIVCVDITFKVCTHLHGCLMFVKTSLSKQSTLTCMGACGAASVVTRNSGRLLSCLRITLRACFVKMCCKKSSIHRQDWIKTNQYASYAHRQY